MRLSLKAWNQSYQTFEAQVEQFNKKIQTTSLDAAELDKIFEIVKPEVARLKILAETAKAKEEQLAKGGCCIPSSKAIWILSALNGTAKICTIGGALLAMFESNPAAKWTGFGIFSFGEIFDSATTIYEAKLSLKNEQFKELSKLNREGAEHAKIFKKFIKQLKEIKHLENELIEKNKTLSKDKELLADHVVIDLGPSNLLDDRITACLREYNELPNRYRHEDIYCCVVSLLIQQLPSDDPLRTGLSDFEPTGIQDMSVLADQSLPIRYLQTTTGSFTSSASSLPRENSEKWGNEQFSKINDESQSFEEIDPLKAKIEYDRKLACYKHLVSQRFKTKRDIAFFDTPNGWRIDSHDGIKKVSRNAGLSTNISADDAKHKPTETSSQQHHMIDIVESIV